MGYKPYKTVSLFLEDKSPETYNFEYEFGVEDYNRLQTFDRYFIYKAKFEVRCNYEKANIFINDMKNKKEYKCFFDLDGSDGSCELIREIYSKLWNWNIYDKEVVDTSFGKINDFGIFGGDTMNSVQTTMGYCIRRIKTKSKHSQNYKDETGNGWGIGTCLQLYCEFGKEFFINDLESIIGFKSYVDVYHTIGNFILVPKYFNPYRNSKVKDYWDRSLWLLKNRESSEKEPWIYKNKKINENIEWNQNQYSKYINTFFLWDYVDSEGNPILVSLPDNSITHFLEISTKRIIRRGCFMVAMLRVQEKIGEDRYSELRNHVFNKTDNIYEGYTTVFEEIRQFLNKSEDAEIDKILVCAKNQINSKDLVYLKI